MKDRKKVLAAVTAGVHAYIESQTKESAPFALRGKREAFPPNLWGVDGRQEMMQGKRMWQMRWFKK